MSSKSSSTLVISPNLVMRGDLKVGGNVEIGTDFTGSLCARGDVHVHSGVKVESDVTSASLRLDPGSTLKGHLQVGEARKPLSRFLNWLKQMTVDKKSTAEKGN